MTRIQTLAALAALLLTTACSAGTTEPNQPSDIPVAGPWSTTAPEPDARANSGVIIDGPQKRATGISTSPSRS